MIGSDDMNGSISINSNEVMEAVGILDEASNVLQSSMLTSISSNFTALIETSLYADGVSTIKEQIESINKSCQNLMTKVVAHTTEFEDFENNLKNSAANYGSSYDNYSNGTSGGGSFSVDNSTNMDTIVEGNPVTNGNLLNVIPALDEPNQVNLLNFLNVNKGNDMTLQNLLFNSANAGFLLTLLKKFLGDTTEVVDTNYPLEVQKLLLSKLKGNSTVMPNLSANTIIAANKYLTSVAKDNSLTFEELVLDDKNKSLLSNAVRDLYDGKAIEKYNVENEVVTDVRNLVDIVAKNNNVDSETIISDPKYLEFLKGGI